MPLVAYLCACGTSYEELEANGYAPSWCPSCGGKERSWKPSRFGFTGLINEHMMDPLEVQAVLENKKMHETMILSGSRDNGEYMVKESGPSWSRPFNNDSLERKQAIENFNANQTGTD